LDSACQLEFQQSREYDIRKLTCPGCDLVHRKIRRFWQSPHVKLRWAAGQPTRQNPKILQNIVRRFDQLSTVTNEQMAAPIATAGRRAGHHHHVAALLERRGRSD
jgi:hypothetical protein